MMAAAVIEERWAHTSSLMATTINIYSDPKKRVTPEDCNPLRSGERRKPPATPAGIEVLKVFLPKQQ